MSALSFDPDAVAIAFGEAHLIPSPVRRLTDDEVRAMFPAEYALTHRAAATPADEAPRAERPQPTAVRRARRGGITL